MFYKDEQWANKVKIVSRMNHACRPNAVYYFDPEQATMEIHAVRPIAAGEEITVSYLRWVAITSAGSSSRLTE